MSKNQIIERAKVLLPLYESITNVREGLKRIKASVRPAKEGNPNSLYVNIKEDDTVAIIDGLISVIRDSKTLWPTIEDNANLVIVDLNVFKKEIESLASRKEHFISSLLDDIRKHLNNSFGSEKHEFTHSPNDPDDYDWLESCLVDIEIGIARHILDPNGEIFELCHKDFLEVLKSLTNS